MTYCNNQYTASKTLSILILCFFVQRISVCGQGVDGLGKTAVVVHPDDVRQTIHSFGASDCWAAKFVGNWADTGKKKQIADWLFSMDTLPDGSPEGIGLSLWRFNIGAGSYEQGAASNIPDEWRREECFLDKRGQYDWKKQQGQQWFMQAAKRRGVKYTLGFSIAPPVFMAANGRAYNGTGSPQMNILKNKWNEYARFMATVATHFQFDYLSPVNEPQWSWGKDRISQEGTQATNDEISALVKMVSRELSAQKSRTEIVVGEAGQWDFLFKNDTDNRGDQIRQFFSPASSNFIGNLPHVAPTISSHSYFTTCPDFVLVDIRKRVAEKIAEVNPSLHTWQTEFGILGNICNKFRGGPRNTSIEYGLYAAKVIHHDLAIANVTSWQWWLAISPYDYSDALVYINDPSGRINVRNCKKDGTPLDSKQLWALGNFSRFVRPGMKRVDVKVTGANDPVRAAADLMISAYKDEISKRIVIVVINPKTEKRHLQLSVQDGFTISGHQLCAYTTDADHNLKKSLVPADNLSVPPLSVVTLTANYE